MIKTHLKSKCYHYKKIERLSGKPQPSTLFNSSILNELPVLYSEYDLLCLCSPAGTRMHIKHRRDTDTYFLANNPGANQHADDCFLFKESVQQREQLGEKEEDDSGIPTVITLSEPESPNELPASSVAQSGGLKTLNTPVVIKLVLALIEDTFSNYQHGNKFKTGEAFFMGLKQSKLASETKQRCGIPISKSIFYGLRGLVYAKQFVERDKARGALWLIECDQASQENDGIVTLDITGAKERFKSNNFYKSKLSGPYLVVARLTNVDGKARFKSMHTIPIINTQVRIPVLSEWHRLNGNVLIKAIPNHNESFIAFPLTQRANLNSEKALPPIIIGIKDSAKTERLAVWPDALEEGERPVAERAYNAIDTSLAMVLFRLSEVSL